MPRLSLIARRPQFETVPQELFHRIVKSAPFADTIALAALSTSFRAKMQWCYEADLESLLRHFVQRPRILRNELRATKSVISGSAALAFIDRSLTDWSSPDCAKDLDIFCLKKDFIRIVLHLTTREGYEIDRTRTKPRGQLDRYDINPSIHHTLCLKKKTETGDRLIDVVECARVISPFRPIAHFHSTVVMNWLTADSITVTYPDLTFNRRGIIHSDMYEPRGEHFVLTEHGQSLVAKYRDRGYQMLENGDCVYGPHRCTEAFFCPHTLRSSTDRHTFTMRFGEKDDKNTTREKKCLFPDNDHWAQRELFWRLGAEWCYGGNRKSVTHVSER